MTTELVCPRCEGRGTLPDPRIQGQAMRNLREKAGLSVHEVARRLDFSASYVSDLERGRRGWNTNLTSRYKAALKK